MILLVYLTVGAFAGLAAGLFGVGGGLVIVPALVVCFGLLSVAPEVSMQLAVGTSLATIVVTSISSVRAHHKLGNVDWLCWRSLAPGIAIGVVFGVATAATLSGAALKLAFGVFSLIIAAYMGLGAVPAASRQLPEALGLAAVGGGVGYVSALFGIGGGALTVPYLTWCNVRMQAAVATSAACGLPIALVGSASNMVAGFGHQDLPAYSFGFVYLPAFIGIVLLSAPFAKLGAILAQRLSARRLKQCFALFLLFVGGQFIWGAL
ncbi:sulfite exporter TauE/SafE family protein [Zhongshania sp.]|uniref:sulfite exporter TauE/SafE family protein n=1 Tax=Zhongshania sp. TaxID=1971902 RepID=UPI001B4D1EF0|nr:sulfite exporter TauE/SafE family protein [Zhongshania sp.]MBQ0795946.1 sulfite exporter TauE/SafE family protein [Zhongshania sp.]